MYGTEYHMKTTDANQSSNVFTRKWTLLVILCVLPLFVIFAVLGDPGRGRAAAGAAGVIMFAARACWDWKEHIWFRVTLAIIIAVHALLVALISWTSKSYPGLILFPVAVLDFAIVYGCIKLVHKMIMGNDQASP